MKFRIEKNIIKFRLSPKEIKLLKSNNYLSEEIIISDENKYEYSIQISEDSEIYSITFFPNKVQAVIPKLKAVEWFNSNQIGIKGYLVSEGEETITLIVEEDLPPRKKRLG